MTNKKVEMEKVVKEHTSVRPDGSKFMTEEAIECLPQALISYLEHNLGELVEADKETIAYVFSQIKLTKACWEDREDIVCVNGKPIGMTVKGNTRFEFDRWWCNELFEEFATALTQHKNLIKWKGDNDGKNRTSNRNQ